MGKMHYYKKNGGAKKVNVNVILTIFVFVLLIITFIILYKYATSPIRDAAVMSCTLDVTVASVQLEGGHTGIVTSKRGHVFMVDIHGKAAHMGDQRKLELKFRELNNGTYRLESSELLFDAAQTGEELDRVAHSGR